MISQTLSDKLLELRLTAFREGLREQSSNPHYADLSFEERLLLLLELECTRRSGSRIQRRLKLAEFPAGTQLESQGNSYYKAPLGTATAAVNTKVRQGQLESSNVNPITSVVELITAQHQVESMRRTLSLFSDEMDKTAAQDLPRVS